MTAQFSSGAARLWATAGLLYWFVATNAQHLPGQLVLPGFAVGAILYALVGLPLLHLFTTAPGRGRTNGPRWNRAPDSLALTAIAAWAFEKAAATPFPDIVAYGVALPFVLASFAIFFEWAPFHHAANAGVHRMAAMVMTLGKTPSVSTVLGFAFLFSLPAILLALVLPLGLFAEVPSALPIVASVVAWTVAFALALVATKTTSYALSEARASKRMS